MRKDFFSSQKPKKIFFIYDLMPSVSGREHCYKNKHNSSPRIHIQNYSSLPEATVRTGIVTRFVMQKNKQQGVKNLPF